MKRRYRASVSRAGSRPVRLVHGASRRLSSNMKSCTVPLIRGSVTSTPASRSLFAYSHPPSRLVSVRTNVTRARRTSRETQIRVRVVKLKLLGGNRQKGHRDRDPKSCRAARRGCVFRRWHTAHCRPHGAGVGIGQAAISGSRALGQGDQLRPRGNVQLRAGDWQA